MKIGRLEVYGVIYKIENLVNGKIYIGQSTEGFDKRYGDKGILNTHNLHLKRSIEKYGVDKFDVTKICDYAFSKKELDIKEMAYIKMYKSYKAKFGYNKTLGGESNIPTIEARLNMSRAAKLRLADKRNHNWYGKHHSLESKDKISKTLIRYFQNEDVRKRWRDIANNRNEEYWLAYEKGIKERSNNEDWKKNISKTRITKGLAKGKNNPMFGKHHSEETIKKIMDKKPNFKGEKNPFYGKKHNEETRDKISQARLKNSKPIVVVDINYKFIKELKNGKEAIELGMSKGTEWSQCCRGRYSKHNGYRFIYKEDYDYFISNDITFEKWRGYLLDKYKKKVS